MGRSTEKQNSRLRTETARSFLLLFFILLGVGLTFWVSRRSLDPKVWWEDAAEQSEVSAESRSSAEEARRVNRDRKVEAPSGVEGVQTDLKQAMQWVDQGRWADAESLLESLLEQDPKNEAALIELAMIKILEREDRKAGRDLLERAVRVNPHNESSLTELMSIYEEARSWEDGLVFLQSLSESSSVVDYARGYALQSLGRSEEAVEALLKAVYEGDFREFDARRNLVDALASSGRYEEALKESEQIIQGPYKPSEQRLGRMQMAHTLMQMKRYGEARRILQIMLDGEPSDRWIVAMLEQVNEAEVLR